MAQRVKAESSAMDFRIHPVIGVARVLGLTFYSHTTRAVTQSCNKARFDISKLVRIERSGDEDDISNKWCDFSSCTISYVMKSRALNTLVKHVKETKGIRAAYDQVDSFIGETKKQNGDQNATYQGS